MGWNRNNLTNRTHGPLAEFAVSSLVYEGGDLHIHSLERNGNGWYHTDLSAATGAPISVSPPTAYTFGAQVTNHVLYLGNGHHFDNTTGAPPAISDPAGHYFAIRRRQHALYISNDHHAVEL